MKITFRVVLDAVELSNMENLDQRLAFRIKEVIEENSIPYAKAAKIVYNVGSALPNDVRLYLEKVSPDFDTIWCVNSVITVT
ncbi:MAG: hypothetical protein H8D23_34315 [Candidatus Brocadiales bacterium]|nr:hypothetical protein [Candidatus Brocadiales bacterium]MBC8554714.1 hypothetical protein [Candidatus Brocadiales bacterium]